MRRYTAFRGAHPAERATWKIADTPMVRGRALLDLGLGRDLGAGVARVLVLGDGDFAYSSALVSALAGLRTDLLATVYDSEPDLLARCPEAAARIDTIRATGARVACSIDARALETQLPGEPPWHRVVFNLPQAPPLPKARNQIQRHRALLREVCRRLSLCHAGCA